MKLIHAFLLCCFALPLSAQTRREQIRERVDSALQAKYYKVSYDTAYIVRPKGRLTLKVRTNFSGNTIHAKGVVDGLYTKADLKTDPKVTLSFVANYQGITAGIAINPAKLKGRNKDYQLNLNIFTNRYSIDGTYQMSKTLAGTVVRGGVEHEVERGYIDMNMLNLTGYYTFNYRRFSYPAAFSQSFVQRRSAGSWLVGFSYQGGSMKTTDEIPETVPKGRIYIGHFGIGGGYGYNLVVREKWLFHISALPTLVLFNRNNITINDEQRKMRTFFPDMIFNERVAVVRNFSAKYFAGATLVMSNTLFNDSDIRINQNKWLARFFFGFRI